MAPAVELEPGTILADKYRVERVLGKGGMGVVVLATHVDLEDRFAIKILTGELDADAQQRFLREARAAAQIKSEHIARVVDVGTLPEGVPFMVMEFLDGTDLAGLIEQRGALPVPEAIELVLQACIGLSEAHARDFIHRDLKPANLFVAQTSDGRRLVKLLDFGISKANREVTLTSTRAVLGTPAYMAPEQWRSAREADVRSDIWSIGVVLHELLSGKRPFRGESVTEMCAAVLTEEPAPLSIDVPVLVKIVARCLEKEPVDRYQRVPDLARDLAAFASDPDAANKLVDRMDRVAGRPSVPILARSSTAPTKVDEPKPAPPPSAVAPTIAARPASKRWIWIAAGGLAIAIGVVAFAITRPGSTPTIDSGVTAPMPHAGVLRIAINRGDETRTALYSNTAARTQTALRMVVERLVDLGSNGEDRESVLQPIEAGSSGTTLILRLRDGVMFHGSPCAPATAATAKDVAFSIEIARDLHQLDLPVSKVEVNQAEVWLVLSAPVTDYKQALSNVRFVPAVLKTCEPRFPELAHPVGTGPFQLGKTTPAKLVLERAPSYWRKSARGERLPRVEKIELVRASDETLAAMRRQVDADDAIHILMLTDADLARYVDFTKQPAALIDTAAGLELATHTNRRRMGLWYLEPTHKPGPLRDPKIRRAIALAIDRKAVVDAAEKTSRSPSTPTGRFLQDNVAGYSAALPELVVDPKRALAEARTLITAGIPELIIGWPHNEAAAGKLAESLRALGLAVKLGKVQAHRMEDERKGGTFDALLVSHWLELHGEEVVGLASLTGHLASDDLKAKVAKLSSLTGDARIAAVTAIEKQLLDELPVIPIARLDPNRVTFGVIVRGEVQGFYDRQSRYVPLELDLDFTETWLPE